MEKFCYGKFIVSIEVEELIEILVFKWKIDVLLMKLKPISVSDEKCTHDYYFVLFEIVHHHWAVFAADFYFN